MAELRKSRYCFLINKGDDYLAYTSATNSFYKINEYVAGLIKSVSIDERAVKTEPNGEELETLHKLRLLTTREEDMMSLWIYCE